MAIEDGYQLSTDLAEAVAKADGYPDLEAVLKVCNARLPNPIFAQILSASTEVQFADFGKCSTALFVNV